MSNKVLLEALNRTLQDLRGNILIMGGLTLLLSGDFRQTLPVMDGWMAGETMTLLVEISVFGLWWIPGDHRSAETGTSLSCPPGNAFRFGVS